MRKGFRVTLATVAIALLGLRAMAVAPTIGDIPDVIVGDAEDTSAANLFVFPDAINLDDWVTDDLTGPEGIIWYYTVSDQDDPEGPTYLIDGVPPFDPATDDPVTPDASKRINLHDDDPRAVDDNPRTITIRDERLSPIAQDTGQTPFDGMYPDPAGGPGIVHSRVVTLFASDGTTVSLDGRSIIVYSDDDGFDRFSPEEGPPAEAILDLDFSAGVPAGWAYEPILGNAVDAADARGLCITVPAGATDDDGRWKSPYAQVELVDNVIYEVRFQITTSQTNPFQTPLFSLAYDNQGDAGEGEDAFVGELFILDNEGGANSPIVPGPGRNEFRLYMAPISFQVPWWRDSTHGAFSDETHPKSHFRIIGRVLDMGLSGAYGADQDSGSLCWESMQVFAHDFSDLQMEAVLEADTLVDGNVDNTQPGSVHKLDIGDQVEGLNPETSFEITGGNAIMRPAFDGAWHGDNATVTVFGPGDQTLDLSSAATIQQTALDNFPLVWDANEAYYIEYVLSAPTSAEEFDPPDVLGVGADGWTAEIAQSHRIIPNTPDFSQGFDPAIFVRGINMPRFNNPQPYGMIHYTHSPSLSPVGAEVSQIWRPRLDILTAPNLQPVGRQTNSGGIQVHSMRVMRITNID